MNERLKNPMTEGNTQYTPKYCVWELTLACNARCVHCGSSAGAKRTDELSTTEALNLIEQLAEAGVETITFSGGEPLLRSDWRTLAEAAVGKGIRIELISNGLLAAKMADDIAAAGFFGVTFSVDGPPDVHDLLRGTPGALDRLLDGVAALKKRGVRIGAATQVNQHNLQHISNIHQLLLDNGFDGWQIQLTMPLGMAAHQDGAICLSPKDLLILEQRILEVKDQSPLFIQTADNLGYMGRYEPRLRSGTAAREQFFTGCQAGLQVVGITSDGGIRGCLSQPDCFNEGSVRDDFFVDVWNREGAFAYNRHFKIEQLTGACADCPFKSICRAGCKSLAHASGGILSENHYCLRLQAHLP